MSRGQAYPTDALLRRCLKTSLGFADASFVQEEKAAMQKLGPKVEVSPATKRLWQELQQEKVSFHIHNSRGWIMAVVGYAVSKRGEQGLQRDGIGFGSSLTL